MVHVMGLVDAGLSASTFAIASIEGRLRKLCRRGQSLDWSIRQRLWH